MDNKRWTLNKDFYVRYSTSNEQSGYVRNKPIYRLATDGDLIRAI